MASTEKLPSGRWRGRYVDADGNKRSVPGTFALKGDAMDAAVDEQAKARRKSAARKGTLSAKTTWGQWWEVFSADREFDSDTALTEARIVKSFLVPRWGDEPLNQIKRSGKGGVQEWVDDIKRGRSASYVQRIFSVFSVSINAAVDREILLASPTAGVKLPKRQKKPKTFLTVEELDKLRPHLSQQVRDAVDFDLETGIRPNELAGLHHHRVDVERGWMVAAEVYIFRKKMIRAWPKDEEPRVLPLSTKAIEIVKRRLEGRDLTTGCGVEHTDGSKCRHALVFLSASGGVLTRDLIGYHLRRAAEKAGIEPKSGYALRRGYATRLGQAGLDVFELQRLMGHSDINLTAEYVQQTDAARARVIAALGERTPLSIVDGGVGRVGPEHGTDLDNQPLPEATKEGGKHVS